MEAQADWRPAYLNHEEMTWLLHDWAQRFGDLLAIESIGTSPEGRDIWLATVHDTRCSPAAEAPGLWVDANIHATEVTASAAALELIWALISPHADAMAQRTRQTRTVYVVPRQNPDGADAALAPTPVFYRSRPRHAPDPHADEPGPRIEDIDGDGRVLLMRIPDANGWWCRCEREPRLLRPRMPHEDPAELECYDVRPEGPGTPPPGDNGVGPLDLNRNYPYQWRGEAEQPGAGSGPMSEPEVRAVVDAIRARPNLGAYLSYHTYSGVHLIPFGDRATLEPADAERYQTLAAMAQALTGLPTEPTLAYWGDMPVYGTSDDWFYDEIGGVAWTTEFWNPLAAAGVERMLTEYWSDWNEDEERALLRWADEVAPGECYVDWYRYEHPQLGPVELGGWDQLLLVNPPPSVLTDALAGHAAFGMAYALALPELELTLEGVARMPDGLLRVDVTVANTGWLPTHVTDRALLAGAGPSVTCAIDAPGVEVVGAREVDLGQLSGAPRPAGVLGDYAFPYGGELSSAPRRRAVSFLLRAEDPGTQRVTLTAAHPRAGRARIEVELAEFAPSTEPGHDR